MPTPKQSKVLSQKTKPVINSTQKQSHQLQQGVRKYGLQRFKDKTHPQMWRVNAHGGHFAKLGPMGELGDDVIIQVDLNPKYRKMIEDGIFGKSFSVIKVYHLFYNAVYMDVRNETDKWIDIKVPADSNDLRKSMHDAIRSKGGSNIRNFPFMVVLNTRGIEYAKVVNKMKEKFIKHKGTHTYDYGKSGNLLDDMGAVKGWYDWILLMSRTKARTLFKTFIQNDIMPIISNIAIKLGLKNTDIYNAARQMFTVKYL